MECDTKDYTISRLLSGAIPRQFGNRVKETCITAEIEQVQKTVLLQTARILTKILEI